MSYNNEPSIRGDDLFPWAGGLQAMLRSAERIAASHFTNAIRRYGFSAEDIAMDAVLRIVQAWVHRGTPPTPSFLCWSVDKAGLDKIRREGGPGGGRRPRRARSDDADAEADADGRVTAGSSADVTVPLFGDDVPDHDDLARPDELAHESVHWGIVATRLGARSAAVRRGERDHDRRAVFTDTAAVVAETLARRAAADATWRCAYADDARLAIWAVIREVEPARFGRYPADAFPSHGDEADRRRAFRLARRVLEMIDEVHRSLYAPGAA
jgi:hypothetical protein